MNEPIGGLGFRWSWLFEGQLRNVYNGVINHYTCYQYTGLTPLLLKQELRDHRAILHRATSMSPITALGTPGSNLGE